MAKSKSHSADEDVKGENRSLKKQVNQLKREINSLYKRLSKYENLVNNFIYEEEKSTILPVRTDLCIACSKGKIVITDLGIRKIITCTECKHREIKKC